MTLALIIILNFVAGAIVGLSFFGALWWTVQKGVRSSRPALLFTMSLILRMGFSFLFFFILAKYSWIYLLVGLAGFQVGRMMMNYQTQKKSFEFRRVHAS